MSSGRVQRTPAPPAAADIDVHWPGETFESHRFERFPMPVSLPTSVLAATGSAGSDSFVDIDVPFIAWVGLLADDRRDAGRRPRAAPRRQGADSGARAGRVARVGLVRPHVRGRRRRRVGPRRVRRVPRRLPDREVAVGRQRVRVGRDLLDLRDPAALPAPRVVLGRVRRARAARDLHHRRRRVDLELLVVARSCSACSSCTRASRCSATGRTKARTGTTAR